MITPELAAALDREAEISRTIGAWLPIESAPKNGREIILGEPGDSYAGFYSTVENRRSWANPDGNWFAEMDRGNEYCAKPQSPTHWQPLPEPLPVKDGDEG